MPLPGRWPGTAGTALLRHGFDRRPHLPCRLGRATPVAADRGRRHAVRHRRRPPHDARL